MHQVTQICLQVAHNKCQVSLKESGNTNQVSGIKCQEPSTSSYKFGTKYKVGDKPLVGEWTSLGWSLTILGIIWDLYLENVWPSFVTLVTIFCMVDDHSHKGGKPPFWLLKNLKNSKFSELTPYVMSTFNLMFFFVESVSTLKIRIVCKNQRSKYCLRFFRFFG